MSNKPEGWLSQSCDKPSTAPETMEFCETIEKEMLEQDIQLDLEMMKTSKIMENKTTLESLSSPNLDELQLSVLLGSKSPEGAKDDVITQKPDLIAFGLAEAHIHDCQRLVRVIKNQSVISIDEPEASEMKDSVISRPSLPLVTLPYMEDVDIFDLLDEYKPVENLETPITDYHISKDAGSKEDLVSISTVKSDDLQSPDSSAIVETSKVDFVNEVLEVVDCTKNKPLDLDNAEEICSFLLEEGYKETDLGKADFNYNKATASPKESTNENDKLLNGLVKAENFDWDEYLQDRGFSTAPPTAFLHVEKSLDSGIKEGEYLEILFRNESLNGTPEKKFMKDVESGSSDLLASESASQILAKSESVMIDVESKKDARNESGFLSYWPAKVLSSCGHLLRLQYEGSDVFKCTHAKFWCDLSSTSCHLRALGWSKERGIPLKLPSYLSLDERQNGFEESDLDQLPSVAKEIFETVEYEVSARIKEGDLLEVLCKDTPYEGAVVQVKENHGGRLLVEYLVSDKDPFWIFFLDNRLKPFGWIKEHGDSYRYSLSSNGNRTETDSELLSCQSQQRSMVFQFPYQSQFKKHELQMGMYLEAINPITMKTVHIATISEIIDLTFFRVNIGQHTWSTSIDDPLLLPINFAKENGIELIVPDEIYEGHFTWDEFLSSKNCLAVPREKLYQHPSALSLGFEEGQMLEAVHPLDDNIICLASIKKVFQHLMLIDFCSDADEFCIYREASSLNLFPAGWSEHNAVSLYVPHSLCKQKNADAQSPCQLKDKGTAAETTDYNARILPKVNVSAENLNQNSLWCDQLFINHCCYVGPYLSKTKVAKLSQHVGAGPVHLVLEEVLGRTINAGYIPTRVLRELKGIPLRHPSWHPTSLKAKFKSHALKASVNVASTAGDVDAFLAELSKTLLCCCNLWSFKQSGEKCPYGCNSLSQASAVMKRKRGIKKKILYPIKHQSNILNDEKQREDDEDDEEIDDDDDLEADNDEQCCSLDAEVMLLELHKKLKQRRANLASVRGEVKSEGKQNEMECKSGNEGFSLEVEEVDSKKRPKLDSEQEKKTSYKYACQPAIVGSNPLEWSVEDVENYVLSQPSISHHAVRLREQEVDGRAFMLLNLPTLVHYFHLSHTSAVTLSQHIYKVNLAHFLNFAS